MKKDELYANLKWQSAGSYHVLASAYDDHGLYDDKATDARNKQLMSGAGQDEPMLWTTQFGSGRVFTTALRGAEWAATGKVTIPIPADLAAK